MATTEPAANVFLQGNFGPVREEVTADSLSVVGELPREIDGLFVRNGPNPQFDPVGGYHWFDGDGMVHGVRLQDGKASYCNRWVRTARWQQEHADGHAIGTNMLSGGRPGAADRETANRSNTHLVWHAGRLLALWEGGEPYELRAPSLDTVGPYAFGGKLRHAFTAHPKLDAQTGELLFFGYNPVAPPYVQYGIVSPAGEIVHDTPVDVAAPVMMHDFAVTERYTIFMNLPLTFDVRRAMQGGPLLRFEPERGSQFGVLPRRAAGSEIRWFAGPACYVFHALNAYEDGAEVVLDGCRYADMDVANLGATVAYLHRWRFNLETGELKEEAIDDAGTEFPRVNDGLVGRPARYGYAARFEGKGLYADAFLKYDLANGRSQAHVHGPRRSGGEGVFVPRRGGSAEDDGWLITYVFDGDRDSSELVVVNAQDFEAPPVARVLLPQRVPYGFHGWWVDGQELADQRQ
jgi:carotenoid cleavage dioxygenase-like enzyme